MEIERKFLLDGLPFGLSGYEYEEQEQAYVSTDPVIRVRKSVKVGETAYVLAVKDGGMMAREEFEMVLTRAQYERLAAMAGEAVVSKTRYFMSLGGYVAEIDVFGGRHNGMVTVEVEFPSEVEAEAFEPLAWFGREVTFEPEYKVSYMAINARVDAV
jgi:CYTH domain-containing protein